MHTAAGCELTTRTSMIDRNNCLSFVNKFEMRTNNKTELILSIKYLHDICYCTDSAGQCIMIEYHTFFMESPSRDEKERGSQVIAGRYKYTSI